jgi:transcriptional regulator with XRE-family HTH domain
MAKWSEKELRPVEELTPEDAAAMKAQEKFVVRAQYKIVCLMKEKNISQAELARRMGVSEARVSSMFSNDKNFTLRTIGRLLHYMGEEAALTTTRELAAQPTVQAEVERPLWSIGEHEVVKRRRRDRRPAAGGLDLSAFAANDRSYEKRHRALPLAS